MTLGVSKKEEKKTNNTFDMEPTVEDEEFPLLPETSAGAKLRLKLRASLNYEDLVELQRFDNGSTKERAIVAAVEELFKAIDSTASGLHARTFDPLFNVFDNIMNYPYEDTHRLINLKRLSQKRLGKIFRVPASHKLLKVLGFEPGAMKESFVLSYDKDLTPLFLSKELLLSRIARKIEELSDIEVEHRL